MTSFLVLCPLFDDTSFLSLGSPAKMGTVAMEVHGRSPTDMAHGALVFVFQQKCEMKSVSNVFSIDLGLMLIAKALPEVRDHRNGDNLCKLTSARGAKVRKTFALDRNHSDV